MSHGTFAIFDVDTRQVRNSGGWAYMGRTQPYKTEIEQLVAATERHGVPLVSTTCVGGNMLDEPDFTPLFPKNLFIPRSQADDSWRAKVNDYQQFFVEKKPRSGAYGVGPGDNSWQIFDNNPNADLLIEHLDVDEWFVFGNAMDVCCDLVTTHLRAQGRAVRYIPELMIPGAACSDCNPLIFKKHVYDRWHDQGIHPVPMAEVLERMTVSVAA